VNFARLLTSLFALLIFPGCGREAAPSIPSASAVSENIRSPVTLEPTPIGRAVQRPPWIAHVLAVDLDHDGLLDVVACEAMENEVVWVRQTKRGVFEETVLARDLRAPVHASAVDIDGDGDLDLVVASMGYIFPNNDRIGTVFLLENDGKNTFTPRPLLERTDRVTDVQPGDFNGDGRVDLALAQFGYDQGSVAWLERTAAGGWQRHVLLELSGAINVGVADFNGDGRPDIVALLSQQWEEVHSFENQGGGGFKHRQIWGSTNEDYGSSGLRVGDLNGDGRPDVLFTNGDGFGPAAMPGPRPWHGVQWLENEGNGKFRYRRVATLPGAYSPIAVDLDRDGATDLVATAAYADRGNPVTKPASLLWLRNQGAAGFVPHVLATAPKDLITVASGDFDGDGQTELVTGGFYVGAATDNMGRITLWRRKP
jgi:hypothetical protein